MGLDGITAGVLIPLAQKYLEQRQKDGLSVVRHANTVMLFLTVVMVCTGFITATDISGLFVIISWLDFH